MSHQVRTRLVRLFLALLVAAPAACSTERPPVIPAGSGATALVRVVARVRGNDGADHRIASDDPVLGWVQSGSPPGEVPLGVGTRCEDLERTSSAIQGATTAFSRHVGNKLAGLCDGTLPIPNGAAADYQAKQALFCTDRAPTACVSAVDLDTSRHWCRDAVTTSGTQAGTDPGPRTCPGTAEAGIVVTTGADTRLVGADVIAAPGAVPMLRMPSLDGGTCQSAFVHLRNTTSTPRAITLVQPEATTLRDGTRSRLFQFIEGPDGDYSATERNCLAQASSSAVPSPRTIAGMASCALLVRFCPPVAPRPSGFDYNGFDVVVQSQSLLGGGAATGSSSFRTVAIIGGGGGGGGGGGSVVVPSWGSVPASDGSTYRLDPPPPRTLLRVFGVWRGGDVEVRNAAGALVTSAAPLCVRPGNTLEARITSPNGISWVQPAGMSNWLNINPRTDLTWQFVDDPAPTAGMVPGVFPRAGDPARWLEVHRTGSLGLRFTATSRASGNFVLAINTDRMFSPVVEIPVRVDASCPM